MAHAVMTTWVGIGVSAMSLLFLVAVALLGLLFRIARQIGRNEQRMEDLMTETRDVASALDEHIKWHLNARRRS